MMVGTATATRLTMVVASDTPSTDMVRAIRMRGHTAFNVDLADAPDALSTMRQVDVVVVMQRGTTASAGLRTIRALRMVRDGIGLVHASSDRRVGTRLRAYLGGADLHFDAGVDTAEIAAASEALGWRVSHSPRHLVSSGGMLTLSRARLRLDGPDGGIDVTRAEAEVLAALAAAPGQYLDTAQLLAALVVGGEPCTHQALVTRVGRLRVKLDRTGTPKKSLRARRARGYELAVALRVI